MTIRFATALLITASISISSAEASTVLYTQNFENPTGFANNGGDVNIFRTVNQNYGNQPAGFTFAQANTVETLLVGGTQAWGTGFLDPQGIAGRYAIGMLSTVENDLLGLSFNIGDYQYLNFRLDVSSIDLDRWGGPFNPNRIAPTFRFSLYDNPSGANGLGSGTPLSTAEYTGTSSPRNIFNWTNFVAGLDATGNTNGNVTLRIDLLTGGYAAMDNFVIAASNQRGDVPPVPEPSAWLTMAIGLGLLARRKFRHQAV